MKKIFKVTNLFIIFLLLFSINTYAKSIELSTDKEKVKNSDEIVVSLKTEKLIGTTTLYLKYDSNKLQYNKSTDKNIAISNDSKQGILKIVYVDMTLNGTNQLDFKFKVKDNVTDKINFSIENITIQFVGDQNIYSKENLNDGILDTSVEIEKKQYIELKDNKGNLVIYCIIILILIVIICIAFIINRTKNKNVKVVLKAVTKENNKKAK